MKKLFLIKLLFIFILTVQSSFALEVPRLAGRVNDYANILTSGQKSSLENLLKKTETVSSAQVVLLTIKSLEGENLEEFSITVAEKWKLGQKEKDNGVLLLIAINDKKIRIEVGYGLEGTLTDLKCGYIIRQLIVPGFRKGNFYSGINNGLTAITGLITKEYEITPEQLNEYERGTDPAKVGHSIFIFIVFVIIILSIIFKGRSRRGYRSSGGFWVSGGGGFSGGGFSGGGGSFGGGGSSGGW